MNTTCRCLISVVGFQGITLAGALLAAGEPTAGELIQRTPVIASDTKDHTRIEIGGYFKQPGYAFLRFRSTYQAPDRYTLSVTDGTDDMPLLLAADRKILVYDPVRPVVLYAEGMDVMFSLSQEGDHFSLYFGWSPETEKTPSNIRLDLRSFFNRPGEEDRVLKVTDREYLLTRTSVKKNQLKCYYNRASPVPMRLELVMKGSEEPTVCIDEILVDGASRGGDVAFPSKDRLSRKLAVRGMGGDSLLERIGGMAFVLRGFYARVAANQPKLRTSVEESLPEFLQIDWDRVHENDRAFSRALKEVLLPEAK